MTNFHLQKFVQSKIRLKFVFLSVVLAGWLCTYVITTQAKASPAITQSKKASLLQINSDNVVSGLVQIFKSTWVIQSEAHIFLIEVNGGQETLLQQRSGLSRGAYAFQVTQPNASATYKVVACYADEEGIYVGTRTNLTLPNLSADVNMQLNANGCPYQQPIIRKTYLLAGQPIATKVDNSLNPATNGLFYVHTDHLGSASTVTNDSGTVLDSQRFLPFGEARTESSTDITDRGFTGHLHNDDIGLVYMNARFYVPSIGRFASADTIVPDPYTPQAFNRYSYVYNNPINLIDPSGHCSGNPAEPKSEDYDAECWEFLETEFCNDNLCEHWTQWLTAGNGQVWTTEELKRVQQGLIDTRSTLERAGLEWAEFVGKLTFRRFNSARVPRADGISCEEAVCKQMSHAAGEIRLSDEAFTIKDYRALIHEIGHGIDYLFDKELRDIFHNIIGSGYEAYPNGTTSDEWQTAKGYYWRDYARTSDSEAFADAFAVLVVGPKPDIEPHIPTVRWDDIQEAVIQTLQDAR